LNRLALFLANFDTEMLQNNDVSTQFTESIEDFFATLAPAIEQILDLSAHLPVLREQQRATRKTFANVVTNLNDVKVQLALGKIFDTAFTSRALENLTLLQQNIKMLRRHVSNHFSTPISETLKNMVSKVKSDLTISLDSDCPENLFGRIRPAEFSQIVDNFIHNAERATKNSLQKLLKISCRANMDRIFISFADSGCGVPENLKPRLFVEQVSSKERNGGFGLYHASQIVARYAGKISLTSSKENNGATFLLELKRIEDE